MQVHGNLDDAWNEAVAHTRRRSPSTFEQWFSGVQFEEFTSGVLRLSARDEFVRDWVDDHFIPELVAHLESSLGTNGIRVAWQVTRGLSRPVSEPPPLPACARQVAPSADRPTSARPPPAASAGRNAWLVRLDHDSAADQRAIVNPKFTFENFIVGPSNELAYAAARAAAGDGGLRYNPLFITGGTGLGKTHLVHAIAHHELARRPDARILYVSADRFTTEFIESLQHHSMDAFRARYRKNCDVLLVDDIQFLAGREQTQEEFFHTFNALRESNRQIVVTADKYPQQLQRMPERLVSRFSSGLVADVQVPQLETRVAIVRKKAELEGIDVPNEVAVMLAQTVKNNVRELEGALIRLAAKSSLTGRVIDEEFAREELTAVRTLRPPSANVEDIQRAVCGHFCITNTDLISKDRHRSIAFARQVAMYLCRQRLKFSYPELGRAFGNRDHTTVMSAVRRVESLRSRDPEVAAHLEAIELSLADSER